MTNTFEDALQQAGYTLPPQIIHDGQIHRFGRDNCCWYVAHSGHAAAGDWSEDHEPVKWSEHEGSWLPPEEWRKLKEEIEVKKQIYLQEEAKRHQAAAIKAKQVLEAAPENGHSDYLLRKRVGAHGGLRYLSPEQAKTFELTKKTNPLPSIIIPFCDAEGRLCSIQSIYNDGWKQFLTGGKVSGCFHVLGSLEAATMAYACEGYATAATIHAITGCPVVMCGFAGNISPVLQTLAVHYPVKDWIIAADNDVYKEVNTGKNKAEAAARRFGCKMAFPTFRDVSTEPTDFNDLACLEGEDEVRRQLASPQSIAPTEEEQWEQTTPLIGTTEGPNIRASLLPEPYASFANALAHQFELEESVAVMAVLGVISVAVSQQFVVSPNEGWSESVNTYTLIAMPPAHNKSAILKAVTEPLVMWEKAQAVALSDEIKRKQAKRKTEEKILEEKRKKAAKERNPAEQAKLMAGIEDLDANLTEACYWPRLFATDVTPEALALELHEQQGRFAVLSDEGGIIETISGLYSSGKANVDVLLKGIDGGYTRIRRSNGKELSLNPYLTLLLLVQPQILCNMSGRQSLIGNGFVERFLYLIPKSYLGSRTLTTPPVPQEVKDAYHKAVLDLLNLEKLEHPRLLTLSPDARREFQAFRHGIETQLAPGGKLGACAGWGGKICGYALRLAGQLHAAKHGGQHSEAEHCTLSNALEIASLLSQHALVAFQQMGADQPMRDAVEILQWVQHHQFVSFTKTELITAFKSKKFGKAESLDAALEVLCKHHILKKTKDESSQKPTTIFKVNPQLGRLS